VLTPSSREDSTDERGREAANAARCPSGAGAVDGLLADEAVLTLSEPPLERAKAVGAVGKLLLAHLPMRLRSTG
jgi:hypothetical protein